MVAEDALQNEKRKKIAKLYNTLLNGGIIRTPIEKNYAKHVFHLYVVKSKKRDKLQDWLKKKGIFTAVHYPIPVHFQPAYQDIGYKKGNFPISEKHSREILSLPMYPELKKQQVEYICETINKFR